MPLVFTFGCQCDPSQQSAASERTYLPTRVAQPPNPSQTVESDGWENTDSRIRQPEKAARTSFLNSSIFNICPEYLGISQSVARSVQDVGALLIHGAVDGWAALIGYNRAREPSWCGCAAHANGNAGGVETRKWISKVSFKTMLMVMMMARWSRVWSSETWRRICQRMFNVESQTPALARARQREKRSILHGWNAVKWHEHESRKTENIKLNVNDRNDNGDNFDEKRQKSRAPKWGIPPGTSSRVQEKKCRELKK